ncbi:MAG: hypothetical protein JWQ43_215, partial [Glaciihabitans sp.]|nr:hypothetical protein [Glaciihabitans sp.]
MIYVEPLLRGLVLTIQLFLVAAALSTVLGILFAIVLDIRHPLWTRVARVYSAVMRGVPPLIVMLVVFLGFPVLGINISA